MIAIENVRLFDEVQARTDDLSESLQQQTATADAKAYSAALGHLICRRCSTPFSKSAARLCEADIGYIGRPRSDEFRAEATTVFRLPSKTSWNARAGKPGGECDRSVRC